MPRSARPGPGRRLAAAGGCICICVCICVGVGAGVGLTAGCGDDGVAVPYGAPLAVDGRFVRDASGRAVLLRGINARVEGVFDVTFDDGRLPLEDIPALEAADCARMRALGINLLRLPVNWSGIEPERDQIDEDYLARVDAAIDCAGDAGVFVLVDLHQDAYSKEIGEDGAPLWAIVPPPEMLLGGPLEDLGERRTSRQVGAAEESFFDPDDGAGLQAEFIDVLALVAARWADHPMVAGFEILNEPMAPAAALYPFTERAAAAIRAVAPDKLIYFEPPAIRNFLDFQPLARAPFPVEGAVYAPHVYTYVFSPSPAPLENLVAEELRPSVDNASAEAEAFAAPLFIGEFGIGPTGTNADLWMATQGELHDEYFAGDAFWLWKEQSQGNWGVYDFDADTGTWTERPQVVRWLSRFHPERIAGEPIALAYDDATEVMRLELVARGGVTGPTTIYVPERHAGGYAITCDGTAVTAPRVAATGLVELDCGGVIEARPAP